MSTALVLENAECIFGKERGLEHSRDSENLMFICQLKLSKWQPFGGLSAASRIQICVVVA